MRIGKPGRWWLLAQAARDGRDGIPIYWTGTWAKGNVFTPSDRLALIPTFTLEASKALQFDSAASAIFAAGIFGLGGVAPIALDFAGSEGRKGEPA